MEMDTLLTIAVIISSAVGIIIVLFLLLHFFIKLLEFRASKKGSHDITPVSKSGHEILAVVPSSSHKELKGLTINKTMFIEAWHRRVWEEEMKKYEQMRAEKPLPEITWGEKPPAYSNDTNANTAATPSKSVFAVTI